MNVFVHHLETLVPGHAYDQDYIGGKLAEWVDDKRTRRIIRQVFRRSGIRRRHSVLPDFSDDGEARLYRRDGDGRMNQPGTGARNRCYQETSRPLVEAVARRALAQSPFSARDITHVITVSCTGFHNPGPDFDLVMALGLPAGTERYHLGFMGCYAAFPALRMARQFCLAEPGAVVLVVCAELCTLHMQLNHDPDSVLANALFSDGVAAALISGRSPSPDRPALRLGAFHSAMAPEGRRDMAWDIGDTGFNLVLSSYVPDVIGLNVARVVEDLCDRSGADAGEVALWAVHPGGKAILDKVEAALALQPGQLAASRQILRDYGNMSSATILFVLQRLLHTPAAESDNIGAMAFGPGLVIETAMLQRIPARRAAAPRPDPEIRSSSPCGQPAR